MLDYRLGKSVRSIVKFVKRIIAFAINFMENEDRSL